MECFESVNAATSLFTLAYHPPTNVHFTGNILQTKTPYFLHN